MSMAHVEILLSIIVELSVLNPQFTQFSHIYICKAEYNNLSYMSRNRGNMWLLYLGKSTSFFTMYKKLFRAPWAALFFETCHICRYSQAWIYDVTVNPVQSTFQDFKMTKEESKIYHGNLD
jgi:hypothetical protein